MKFANLVFMIIKTEIVKKVFTHCLYTPYS